MKKNILIITLSIVTSLSLLFAYQQKRSAIEANEAKIKAETALSEQLEKERVQLEIAEMNYQKSKNLRDSLALLVGSKSKE